ncbi:probable G-protein coupled receptor CG31760 [Paramacrobiotus metropolitanus]|uniref:probable G-protein coupled receptor CG31760 n=1 Tax=Paramacrobiotus metropolitanus TaxID=2943436 RepID=UPI002445B65D|nr:probable G-protein coupled receptor CG31760 [Paramacrobiotus metropolitanus]
MQWPRYYLDEPALRMWTKVTFTAMQIFLTIYNCYGQPSASFNFAKRETFRDTVQEALQYVENVKPGACDSGTSNTLNVLFDNLQWKAQANAAVRLSNLLTKNWLITNGSGGTMNDELLFAMTRTTIEIEELAFGCAIAFEPYFYRNMSKFCAYSFHTGNGSIKSHDISVEYDYFPSEWYLGTKNKALNLTKILERDVSLRLSDYNETGVKFHKNTTAFIEPIATLDDGFWTRPYFDCGGGDIWMTTFNSPIFAHINGSLAFAGVATCDIALNILDIDQCDPEGNATKVALNVFQGTHHCKTTTKCIPRTGFGFRRGTYLCSCRPGYYFPNKTDELQAFVGFDVESAFARWINNGSMDYFSDFDCIPCPEGCAACHDATPCMAAWNWFFRGILLALVFGMTIGVGIVTAAVIRYISHPVIRSASALFLLVTCLGGFVSVVTGMIVFGKPSRASCMSREWFQHIGFALIYGPLLLKNWRIATIFTSIQGAKKVNLTDNRVMARLLFFIVIPTTLYLTVWTVVRPPNVDMFEDLNGLKFYMCREGWMNYAIIIAQCIFLLWGVYLCYQIRNVASSFNESKLIAWTIYNTIFMKNFLIIIRTFMIGMVGPDILYLMYIIELQIPVTCTFAIIYGPKLYFLRTIVIMPQNPDIQENETVQDVSTPTIKQNGFVSKLNNRF